LSTACRTRSEPVLVPQVKFTEWTSDDQLRQPVFLGLRTDKQAKDVVRETRGMIDMGTGDQRAVDLAQQYQGLLNAIRAEQTSRPLPPGAKSTEAVEEAVGDLSDPNLPGSIKRPCGLSWYGDYRQGGTKPVHVRAAL